MPIISVIIPAFGEPLYLEKAIKSVQNQTISDWELIIVDDNNPNSEYRTKTESLVSSFLPDKRIVYLKHPENRNGSAARNTGFRNSVGKYISFLDSDDEYMPKRLEKCLTLLDKQSNNVAAVYTGCEFRRRGKTYHVEKRITSGNFLIDTLACRFMLGTGSNIFVRRCVIEELHGFDESFLRHQDYEFFVRLFERYSIVSIQEPLVIKNNDNTNLPDAKKMIAIKEHYIDKYKSIIDRVSQKDQCYIYHYNWLSIAELALQRKDYELSTKYYRLASCYKKLSVKGFLRRVILWIRSHIQ